MNREIDRIHLNDDVIAILSEETLTDDSKVYNVILVGAQGRAMTTFRMDCKTSASRFYMKLAGDVGFIGVDMDCLG